MLWACCQFPLLPLEVQPAGAAAGADRVPRVVYDGPIQRSGVWLADAAALAAGVRPGQSLAAARALCAHLLALRRAPDLEQVRLHLLATLAYASSSEVVLDPPDALLLEARASLRLFGGWPALRRQLTAAFAAAGHVSRIALAPSPLAARLLTGLADGDGNALAQPARLKARLDPLPLTAARLPERICGWLQAMGVRTLGEARALPTAALARRVGPDLVRYLAQLYGDAPDPRPLWTPPPVFTLRCEFDYGIDSSAALLFPAQRLTGELAAHLKARDAAVQRFQLRFGHLGPPPTTLAIGLRSAVRAPDALFDAVRGRLEAHTLAAPAIWLALEASELPPFIPPRRDLFDAASRAALDWEGLVERLRARLGDGAVSTLAVQDEHRPERAWRKSDEYSTAHVPPRTPQRAERNVALIAPRPFCLLPAPEPLRAAIVRFVSMPERIESGWWDEDEAIRDYVIADLETGQRAWLFRRANDAQAPWWVHGWF